MNQATIVATADLLVLIVSLHRFLALVVGLGAFTLHRWLEARRMRCAQWPPPGSEPICATCNAADNTPSAA